MQLGAEVCSQILKQKDSGGLVLVVEMQTIECCAAGYFQKTFDRDSRHHSPWYQPKPAHAVGQWLSKVLWAPMCLVVEYLLTSDTMEWPRAAHSPIPFCIRSL